MLIRSYSKTNNLTAEEVITTLKQQYPQRQWVASSKLSSDEIQSLNNHFNVEDRLPSLPSTESLQEQTEQLQPDSESPIENQESKPLEDQPASDDQPKGQIEQAPQQLPQAQQSSSEMVQAVQFLLTQQQSLGYSSELKAESAALDGSSDAYREFVAYQQGYKGTAQGLQQLAQTLDELRYKASTDGFERTQKDFLSSLRQNSETSQASKSQQQQRVNKTQAETFTRINAMQLSVLKAVSSLKKTGS